jgi:hypothetical protein
MIEIDEPIEENEPTGSSNIDKVNALIEGLSSATTIAQIRSIAKGILESTCESEEVDE